MIPIAKTVKLIAVIFAVTSICACNNGVGVSKQVLRLNPPRPVSDGNVYVGSFDRKVYCLEAANGKKTWEFVTGALVFSSPAVSNGYVYVGSADDKVYCLKEANGEKVWEFETGVFSMWIHPPQYLTDMCMWEVVTARCTA